MRVCEQLLLCVAPVRAHSEVDDSGLHGGLRPGRAAAEAGGPRAGADLQCMAWKSLCGSRRGGVKLANGAGDAPSFVREAAAT